MYSHFVYTKSKKDLEWRAEDSFRSSKISSIFSIADGVTLLKYTDTRAPTLARQVADIFCTASMEYIENNPQTVSTDKIYEAYNYAKNEIQKHYENLKVDTDNERGVTGAIVVVGEDSVIGSRFLDSGLALFREGKQIFKTPEFWSWKKTEDDKPYPYITLNDDMKPYVQTYEISYEKGDLLVLYTDGFELQFSLTEFVSIFESKNIKQIEEKLKKIDAELSEKDSEKYGDERTIAVVLL